MPDAPELSTLTLAAIQSALERGTAAALATLIAGPANVGSKILFEEDGTVTGSFGADPHLNSAVVDHARSFLESREDVRAFTVKEFAPELSSLADARVLFERIQPEPHLVICGAGHVGAALAKLASFLGYRATLIDDRAEFVSPDRFSEAGIRLVACEDWTDAVRRAVGSGHGVFVAIVTRGHNQDEECIRALIDTDPEYIGLIGSKRRTNIVLERLQEAGASEDFRKRVRAPIGLNIGAVTPEEVALAILSEIVADRRGGSGGSLSAWRRR
jgi:xanthine dehydrogenase accessory factor